MVNQLKNVFIVKSSKYTYLALLKSVAVSTLEKGKIIHWSESVGFSNCLLTFHYSGRTDDIFCRD